jgi:hypothetical protein
MSDTTNTIRPESHRGHQTEFIVGRARGPRTLVACLVLAAATSCGCAKPAQERAIAEIRRLEGKVEIDEKAPERPLVKVDLSFTRVTDAGLVHLAGTARLRELYLCGTGVTEEGLEHLSGLTNLRVLDLWRCESLTDASLKHLGGMTGLRRLSLWNTEITDAGLMHLNRLTTLQEIDLSHTEVTDAGLKHLEGLTSLQKIGLIGCEEVTDAGIEGLKRALPQAEIAH